MASVAVVGKGGYLLVHPDGDQYVGSAYGEGGFLGRWTDYVASGHGGNRLLKKRGRANYTVFVLEVASSAMSPAEIVGRGERVEEQVGLTRARVERQLASRKRCARNASLVAKAEPDVVAASPGGVVEDEGLRLSPRVD